jgi:predicted kinase
VAAIVVPDSSLVVLVGAAGAGKSTFAARHFRPDEILSSDAFRAILTGDERDQRATRTAFSILHREVVSRLAAGRLVVVDATNVERHARRALVKRARTAGAPAIAIVLALPESVVHARNAGRTERVVDADVVARHLASLAVADPAVTAGGADADALFDGEGFDAVHVLRSEADVEAATIERRPTRPSRR